MPYTDEQLYEYLRKNDSRKSVAQIIKKSGRTREDVFSVYDKLLADVRKGDVTFPMHTNGAINAIARKSVKQYDKNGKYIATYDSMTEAANAIGDYNAVNRISKVCRGVSCSHLVGGYMWRYAEAIEGERDLTESEFEITAKNLASVETRLGQYTLQGELIAVFPNLKSAADKFGGGGKEKSNISNCCRGASKSAYGYKWKYLPEEKQDVSNWLRKKMQGGDEVGSN